MTVRLLALTAMLLLLGSAGPPGPVPIDATRLDGAAAEPQNWLSYGSTNDGQRFSRLALVDTGNVGQLGLAWSHEFDVARGMEATPLIADGVLYTTTAWSKVYAFNAATGAPLWSYDPQVPGETGFKACCDVVNRGGALYQGKFIFGSLDGRLIALDIKTGKPLWSVVTVDQSKPYTITGAPRIAKGLVLIGNGGGEYGMRGYITAYDANTGKLVWRFYTVPPMRGAPADGAASDAVIAKMQATWSGDWSKYGGGGPVWDTIVYDKELNQIIFGVGNGTPWDQRVRSDGTGDNLFVDSIVAVDADTGAYRWHYAGSPGESLDFDQTQSIVLTDMKLDGTDRKVMLQAPKNGFFYVIDRRDGKLLSAKPYVTQTWTKGIDMKTGRPVYADNADYAKGAFVSLPSAQGAHNWQPMAYSPVTRLAYIPAQEVPMVFESEHPFVGRPGGWNLGVSLEANKLPDNTAELKALRAMLKGHLAAWDPATQTERWRVQQEGPWNGGVLATAGGLVFQGTARGELAAYAADTGRKLWSYQTGIGIMAPPVTYSVGGKQYVAVMAGYGGGYGISAALADDAGPRPNGRLFVFALGGNAPYKFTKIPLQPAVMVKTAFTPAQVALGGKIFSSTCGVCHGFTARSSGVVPDLRRSGVLDDKEAWNQILIGGALKSNGMISFSQWLSADDAEAVRGYVAERARNLAVNGN